MRLILCLKRYKRDGPAKTGEPGAPVHDDVSHAADALRGLATVVDRMTNEDEAPIHNSGYKPIDQGIGL